MRSKVFISKNITIFLLFSLVVNIISYNGTRFFTKNMYHHDMTTSIDEKIPFIPETILIYIGCYIFWIINYYLGCHQNSYKAKHFLCADCFAKIICGICFIFIPTTNIRPQITENDFYSRSMLWLYNIDPADNLFPSIHCLTSWLCIIAVRNQNNIPAWYKVLSVFIAISVCVSTITTKQHVITDVIFGISLAEISYIFVIKSKFYICYKNIIYKLFCLKENADE